MHLALEARQERICVLARQPDLDHRGDAGAHDPRHVFDELTGLHLRGRLFGQPVPLGGFLRERLCG